MGSEGVINYDSIGYPFRGDISLAIPDSANKYIDSDKYHMLSFGVTVNDPNEPVGDDACSMFINWTNSADSSSGWQNLLYSSFHVGNGWDRWNIIGPIDLNDTDSLEWGAGDAKELWIRFQAGMTVKPPVPIDIRIGWIRLEESAQ